MFLELLKLKGKVASVKLRFRPELETQIPILIEAHFE